MVIQIQSKNTRTTKENSEGRNKMVQRSDKLWWIQDEDQKSHYQTVLQEGLEDTVYESDEEFFVEMGTSNFEKHNSECLLCPTV